MVLVVIAGLGFTGLAANLCNICALARLMLWATNTLPADWRRSGLLARASATICVSCGSLKLASQLLPTSPARLSACCQASGICVVGRARQYLGAQAGCSGAQPCSQRPASARPNQRVGPMALLRRLTLPAFIPPVPVLMLSGYNNYPRSGCEWRSASDGQSWCFSRVDGCCALATDGEACLVRLIE